ncbi:hypothetical protein B484DRAFT_451252 [Ochromonadaceae sp. CCMP2298]|nr:hypothetical protein B484DRAFT_451252 [Ochromonadaceae sp. CCMP2298]
MGCLVPVHAACASGYTIKCSRRALSSLLVTAALVLASLAATVEALRALSWTWLRISSDCASKNACALFFCTGVSLSYCV